MDEIGIHIHLWRRHNPERDEQGPSIDARHKGPGRYIGTNSEESCCTRTAAPSFRYRRRLGREIRSGLCLG